MQEGRIGIYVHWPFCLSKCPYCDFNVFTTTPEDMTLWKDAYLNALRFYASYTKHRALVSVYFGGGTPSLMPPDLVGAIIDEAKRLWPKHEKDIEITLESNPTSTETAKLQDFRAAGVNRISLGVQSLRADALKFLGRLHGRDDVLHALEATARIFDRTSIDMIYDRPGQSVADWKVELEETRPYMNGHVSAYQLTIKDGTAFEKQVKRGGFTMSDDDHSADLFEVTQAFFDDAGMPAYEVSNYGAAGQESRHNIVYWLYDDYIGIGPGAHGRVTMDGRKTITEDFRKPKEWLACVREKGHGAQVLKPMNNDAIFEEAFIMGMRLYDGRSLKEIAAISGIEAAEKIDLGKIAALQSEGLVAYDPATQHLRYTRAGMMRSNALNALLLK